MFFSCEYLRLITEFISFRKLERRFDLYYYGGVARYVETPGEQVRLTIGKCLLFVAMSACSFCRFMSSRLGFIIPGK